MSAVLSQALRTQALEMLCQAVETVTVNPGCGEQPLAELLCARLRAAGLEAQIQPFAPGRANVCARLRGRGAGPALLLNGHLDTVPFGADDAWGTPPGRASIQNGVLYGRGASDMKGGLCAMAFALETLANEGFIPACDILFLGTGDEEADGLGAQAAAECGLLENVGRIVIGEPTGNRLAVASKGTLWIECAVRGKTCHGAYPWEGVNAAETAWELAADIKAAAAGEATAYLTPPTCTLTQISGGVKVNMVPDLCRFSLDIRTVPGMRHEEILDAARAAAKRAHAKGAEVSLRVLTDRAAMRTDPEEPLVQELTAAVTAARGNAPELCGTNFFSDASVFLRYASIPTVLFGPGESSEAHKPNESLLLERYFESIACYIYFLQSQSAAKEND